MFLDRRDWVYSLGLLIPFVVYNLLQKAIFLLSVPRLAANLDLILSNIFFNLGYVLFWIGIFAAVRGREPLRRVVILLFHSVTILVLLVNTCAYQYFRETGVTLNYGTAAQWISKLGEHAPVPFQGVPLSVWVLLTAVLLYATLGPLLLTRAVERWRDRSEMYSSVVPSVSSFLRSLGLCILALGLGSLSLEVGTSALAGEPFVNIIVPGVERAEEVSSDPIPSIAEEDNPDPVPVANSSPAHATLVQTPQTEKRNVVLVHLESTRERSVTPYNEDLNTTPFLNELAKSSLLVEQAHVGSIPRSSMSNTSINCGIQPPPRSAPDEPGTMPIPCLASLLNEQGYSTAFFSSNADEYGNLATANWGYEKVFAPLDPAVPPQYQDTTMNTEGLTKTSHYGYEEDIMLKPSENWLKERKDRPFVAEYLTNTGHDEYNCLGTRYGSENFSNDDLLNHYLNCLRLQDIFLQDLFEQYKELGLYENTIFILFGDHGEGFGEHGRFMHGDTPWEEGLRVPLIIHDPKRFQNGERVQGPSNYTDVLPTIVEMLGYEVKDGAYPGYSLLHPLPEERPLFFSCISERKCLASIKGSEKYIYHYDNQPEEVFDLSKDPLEEHNLADQYSREELDKRREELFEWLSKIDDEYGRGSLPSDRYSEEDVGQQANQSERQVAEPTVVVGQPLTVGDVEWTVTKAYPTNQLLSPMDGGVKRGSFVVVDFQLQNNSDEGLDPSSDSLALFEGNGRKIKFDTDTYLYVPWSEAIFRFEVGPGASEEGQVIFEVSPGSNRFQLQLGERNPFSNKSGYVTLGF